MKNSYINLNQRFWNREYFAPNVEEFIFRLKPILLNQYINFKKKKEFKVLDFGCGEGSNIKYLSDAFNFTPYGVDISYPSIKECKKKIYKFKNNFKIIKPQPKLSDNFYNTKFDLIISIQTLYYLSNEDLKTRLLSFKKMLKPNGYVFFTMMSTKMEYWRYYSNKKVNSAGLTLVNLSSDQKYKKRQKQSTYKHFINFCKNEKHLIKKFKLFKKLNIGYYDGSLESTKLSGHHFTFFGKTR